MNRYLIASFRSRNETILFSNLLNSYQVKSNIVSTPRQATTSCGISVKFMLADLQTAREILARRKFNTFAGFFLVEEFGKNKVVKPI